MTNTKDDPRENDWAEKRIAELYERIARLEKQTDYTELEFRVSALEGHPRVTQAEGRAGGYLGFDFSPPIGGRKYERDLDDELEGTPDVHGNFSGDPMVRHESGGATIGGRKLIGPAHAHLDAPCTEACYEPGGVAPSSPKEDPVKSFVEAGPFRAGDEIPMWVKTSRTANAIRDRLMEIDKVPNETAERSRSIALDAAEKRVRDYMGVHFSTATIEGVIGALRGRVAPEDDPLLETRLPSRSPMTFCPGEVACWAAEKSIAHFHDGVGVVHQTGA